MTYLFPSPSSSSPSSVRSARSLHKGHFVFSFFFSCIYVCVRACVRAWQCSVCSVLICKSLFSFLSSLCGRKTLCETLQEPMKKPSYVYGYCLINNILLGINTIFNQILIINSVINSVILL